MTASFAVKPAGGVQWGIIANIDFVACGSLKFAPLIFVAVVDARVVGPTVLIHFNFHFSFFIF